MFARVEIIYRKQRDAVRIVWMEFNPTNKGRFGRPLDVRVVVRERKQLELSNKRKMFNGYLLI